MDFQVITREKTLAAAEQLSDIQQIQEKILCFEIQLNLLHRCLLSAYYSLGTVLS